MPHMPHISPLQPGDTLVVFRKFSNSEVIALFPAEDERDGLCLSYMHVGQHDTADYEEVIGITVPAKAKEYAGLKSELEGIGYRLAVRRRFTRKLL